MTDFKTIDTVIFDLDGTLLYTLEDLMDAVNHTLRTFGHPEVTLDQVRQFAGNGVRRLIELSAPEGTADKEIDEMFSVFKEYYDIHCLDKTKPYDGVVELTARLKRDGYKMAIVSNKIDSAVKELRDRFFPDIDVAIGDREGIRRKPAPDTVNIALEELGSLREKAVYVGDSEVDYATAVNSKLPCISVLWGFRSRETLVEAGAYSFVNDTEELYKRIRGEQA